MLAGVNHSDLFLGIFPLSGCESPGLPFLSATNVHANSMLEDGRFGGSVRQVSPVSPYLQVTDVTGKCLDVQSRWRLHPRERTKIPGDEFPSISQSRGMNFTS